MRREVLRRRMGIEVRILVVWDGVNVGSEEVVASTTRLSRYRCRVRILYRSDEDRMNKESLERWKQQSAGI